MLGALSGNRREQTGLREKERLSLNWSRITEAIENVGAEGWDALARKTHKKASKAASLFCKFLVFNKLNFTKRTPLR
jgi:hypothetical protein